MALVPACVFCERLSCLGEMGDAVAFDDGYPLAAGHTLVVPRRHCADLFDLDDGEYRAVWALVREVRNRLTADLAPDGINVGVNAGIAAGQTVAHAHVHLIPRWLGDVPDPRGGVRWVLPERADYWTDRDR